MSVKNHNAIIIHQGTIKEIYQLTLSIPEFDKPYSLEKLKNTIAGKQHLLLIASYPDNTNLGFKTGYDRYQDGSFYSWLGGILPKYRRQGIATLLADYQESWAKENGFGLIRLKTQKKFSGMIQFATSRHFQPIVSSVSINKFNDKFVMEKRL